MGRGRAKAKQTKVARRLKYFSPDTDLSALEQELHTSTQQRYGALSGEDSDDDSEEDDLVAEDDDLDEDDDSDDESGYGSWTPDGH